MAFDCGDAIEAEAVKLSKPFPHVIEAEAVGKSDPLPNYLETVNHQQLWLNKCQKHANIFSNQSRGFSKPLRIIILSDLNKIFPR